MRGREVIRVLGGWQAHCIVTQGKEYYRQRLMDSVDDACVVVGCLVAGGILVLGAVVVTVIH